MTVHATVQIYCFTVFLTKFIMSLKIDFICAKNITLAIPENTARQFHLFKKILNKNKTVVVFRNK